MSAKVLKLRQKSDRWEKLKEGYFRYRPTGVIYYREKFKRLGVPPMNVPTGETTIGRARTAVQKLRADWINKHTGRPSVFAHAREGGKLVREVTDDLLLRYTPTVRASTQKKQRKYLGEIAERLGSCSIASLSARDLDEWIAEFRRRGKTKQRDGRITERKTFDDYVKHLNLLTRWAHDQRYTAHLVRFKNPAGIRANSGRVYSDDEIKRLWAVMSDATRDKFTLSYECMMRLREALHLEWSRVDLATGKVTLRPEDVKTGSKTGKGREFIVSPHALQRLKARFKLTGKGRYVFPSPSGPHQPVNEIRNAWELAKSKAGITGRARWHDLRHSSISKALLVAGIPPLKVSQYAGVSMHTAQAATAVSIFSSKGKQGVNGNDGEE